MPLRCDEQNGTLLHDFCTPVAYQPTPGHNISVNRNARAVLCRFGGGHGTTFASRSNGRGSRNPRMNACFRRLT
jgi:hypothetical protein